MTLPDEQALHELRLLEESVRQCAKCPLHAGRKIAVPGEGPVRAEVMLIGEAPGRAEDQLGRPFVGRAGRFLDQVLQSLALDRSSMYITSSVKCRPPFNRRPRPLELSICRKAWLERQIELVNPRLLVLLGLVAVEQVMGHSGRLADLHGQWHSAFGRPCLITAHPAAAMRFPPQRLFIQSDFAQLQQTLQ